jgi:glycosyltransferase involved in cell wall biosynthesis
MPKGRCVVSVITPLYNAERYIAECIGSVLDQTLRDLEVLVVDDGSQDRSVEIVKEIACRDDRVRLLQHPGGVNMGVSRTRRLAIVEASGKYIAYLDADDAFEPTKLERQVGLLEDHADCLLCHTGIKGIPVRDEDQERTRLIESEAKGLSNHWNGFRPEVGEYSFLDRPDALKVNIICNSSVLAVADAIRSMAAATSQLFQYEDYAQWTLLATKGPFLFTPEPLTRYRVHSESSTYAVSKDFLRRLYSMIEFLLTVHALTDDHGVKANAERELLYNLSRIRDIYSEGAPGGTADSAPGPRQAPGKVNGYSWEHSVLELHANVRDLQTQVKDLSERLATVHNSRVYRCLVKVRNLLNAVRPEARR